MPDQLDTVARAIQERLLQHHYAMSRDTAADLAKAAIHALELVEERTTAPVWIEDEGTCPCGSGNRRGHYDSRPRTRLVSAWVRAESSNDR